MHDGLIYMVAMAGPMRVYDAATLDQVYAARLDMNTIMFAYPYPHGSGVCASPALGGKNIYFFGNGGHSMVIKPGRTFELVAENRIERLMPGFPESGGPSNEGFYPETRSARPSSTATASTTRRKGISTASARSSPGRKRAQRRPGRVTRPRGIMMTSARAEGNIPPSELRRGVFHRM